MHSDFYDGTEEFLSELDHEECRMRDADSSVGQRVVSPLGWDSPAEREFAMAIGKYLKEEVDLRPGRNVQTQIGAFRPDMILSVPGRSIGLEVDGRQFHKDPDRDYLRDAALLAGRFVNVIYRFAASSTWYRQEDCLFVLAKYEWDLFDRTARELLIPRLASDRVRNITDYCKDGCEFFGDPPDEGNFDGGEESVLEPLFFRVSRRALDDPHIDRTNRWVSKTLERRGPMPFPQLLVHYKRAVCAAVEAKAI